jgi:hypothetical protein
VASSLQASRERVEMEVCMYMFVLYWYFYFILYNAFPCYLESVSRGISYTK